MKTITTLLIAALTLSLGLAQGATTDEAAYALAKQKRKKEVIEAIKKPVNLAGVAAAEVKFAENLDLFSNAERGAEAHKLQLAYIRVTSTDHKKSKKGVKPEDVAGHWASAVIPRYVKNWDTATEPAVATYYAGWSRAPRLAALKAATVAEEFDAAVAGLFTVDSSVPERLRANMKNKGPATLLGMVTAKATEIGHPEAVNYALACYRLASVENKGALSEAVAKVSRALQLKDGNNTRSAAWLAGQNTGTPVCAFTDAEKSIPPAMTGAHACYFPVTMQAAKLNYGMATKSASLNVAIDQVATALKAIDLNLSRANAWIASRKGGTSFDLP